MHKLRWIKSGVAGVNFEFYLFGKLYLHCYSQGNFPLKPGCMHKICFQWSDTICFCRVREYYQYRLGELTLYDLPSMSIHHYLALTHQLTGEHRHILPPIGNVYVSGPEVLHLAFLVEIHNPVVLSLALLGSHSPLQEPQPLQRSSPLSSSLAEYSCKGF